MPDRRNQTNLTVRQTLDATGVTRRRLYSWRDQGLIKPTPGVVPLSFPPVELEILSRAMLLCDQSGFDYDLACHIARVTIESGQHDHHLAPGVVLLLTEPTGIDGDVHGVDPQLQAHAHNAAQQAAGDDCHPSEPCPECVERMAAKRLEAAR